MIALDWHPPPAIIAPEQLEQVKRRRNRTTPLILGAIILGSDGTPCRVVHLDGTTVYCIPLAPPK
jgi:hypothetical protein